MIRDRARLVGLIALVASLYVVAGRIGLSLAFVHGSATAVWAPTGIAMGALLLYGQRVWPGVFLGAFLVNMMTAGHPAICALIAIGNTLEALAGSWLVRSYAGGVQAFTRSGSVLRFGLYAGTVATTISSSIGTGSLLAGGLARSSDAGSIWLTWWLGDAAGALIVTPVVVLWATRPRPAPHAPRWIEGVLLVLAMLGLSLVAFSHDKPGPIDFLCVPVLAWAAVRLEPHMTAALVLLFAAISIWGTMNGMGPFAVGGENDALLLLQTSNALVSLVALTLAAAFAEGRRADARYRLLADAGRVLAQSVSGSVRLREVAELAVAAFADRCSIHRVEEDGSIRWAISLARDVKLQELARSLELRALDRQAPEGVARAVRTGQSLFYADMGEEALVAHYGHFSSVDPPDPERLRIVQKLGLRSCLVVPLLGRGQNQRLGAITFASSSDPHRFGEEDLRVAEDLARLLVLAMDNARLFRESQRLALHDALTGLPNRTLFLERLSRSLAHARRRRDYGFAVLFLDLDGFKAINDAHGHPVGDEVLVAVAERLEGCLQRGGDTVGRLGGDEFVVFLDDVMDARQAARVASRIEKALSRPIRIGGRELHVRTSVGIAMASAEYERAEDILQDADTAMYRAKRGGRGRYEVFDPELHREAIRLSELESDLGHAIERGQLLMHYQPIVALDSGRTVACEALVRWQHPERGLVYPSDLMAVASGADLMERVGVWALLAACAQAKAWESAGLPRRGISVNLSPRLFRLQNLAILLRDIIRDAGIEPGQVELELTEGYILDDVSSAIAIMRELKDVGLRLAIDDFGTGHSSLGYLRRFPVDTIKIDPSLSRHAATNEHDAAFTRAVIDLAHHMRLRVIAEGVESAEQLSFLRQHGCDAFQGFYFARPMPASEMEALLRAAASFSLPD